MLSTHTTQQEQDIYQHVTINPKIGLNYKNFWLKAGPSFAIQKNYPNMQRWEGDRMLKNNVGYNVHLSYNILNRELVTGYFDLMLLWLDFYRGIFEKNDKE